MSDDPDPPPAIKVEAVKGAGTIEVKGGKQGPVVSIGRGAGRRPSSFLMTLGPPASDRITFRIRGAPNVRSNSAAK